MSNYFHIVNKSAGKLQVYNNEDYKLFFIKKLSQHKIKFEVKLLTYAIMNTHLHLVFYAEEIKVRKLMAALNQNFSQYYNKMTGRSGHTLANSFYCRKLDDAHDCKNTIRYVHYNPVKHMNVAGPWRYDWSGYNVICTFGCPRITKKPVPTKIPEELMFTKDMIDIKDAFAVFGENPNEAYDNFISFHKENSDDVYGFEEKWEPSGAVFGYEEQLELGINFIYKEMTRHPWGKYEKNDEDRKRFMKNLTVPERHDLIRDLKNKTGLNTKLISVVTLCSRQTIYRVLNVHKAEPVPESAPEPAPVPGPDTDAGPGSGPEASLGSGSGLDTGSLCNQKP